MTTMHAKLWEPVARAHRAGEHHRVRRADRGEAPRRRRHDYARLWRWSVDHKWDFWREVWDYGGVIGTPGRARAARRGPDAGRALVPGRAAQLRAEPARAAARRRRGRRARVLGRGQGRAACCRTPICTRWRRASRRRSRAHGVERGRPRRRVPAEHARGDRRDARRPRPAARSGRRARRTSACRASLDRFGQIEPRVLVDRRRLLVQRQADPDPRQGRRRSSARLPSVERVVVVPYLAQTAGTPDDLSAVRGAVAWDVWLAPFARGSHRLRRAAVRASALHPVFVRHDRRAEVHRARRRRHAAAAPEGAPAARRREAAATALFYFTTCGWMMWNWLVSGARRARDAAAVRRVAVHRPRARSCGSSPTAERMTHFGTSAKYIDAQKKIALVPRKDCEPRHRAHDVLDRQPAGAGELRLRLPVREGRPLPVVDLRRHRHRVLLRARHADAAGVARRDPVPRPRDGRRRATTRTGTPLVRREGRARLHVAVPVDAGRLLERSRRRQVSRRLLRALPRRSGATATGSRSPSTTGSSSTAAPTRRSIRAACASAPPRSTGRSSSCPRSSKASSSARTGRPARSATCASCCS